MIHITQSKRHFTGIILLLLLLCAAGRTTAQSHIDIVKSAPRDATFAQVDEMVAQFFRNNPELKGNKQWQRWKWYAERHLDMDGKVANITARTMAALEQLNISSSRFGPLTSAPDASGRLNGDWSPIGPFAIAVPAQNYLGRVNCVAFHPSVANTIFAGTPGGGLWRSITNGNSWTPLTDGLPSSGISGIAINPSNANIMYVLTGDGNGGNQWGYYVKETGCGVYKSTDGGTTWFTTGLSWQQSDIRYGYKLIIHPSSPNTLLAATSNGIYRTTDGGDNWTQEVAGEFQDIEFKANDPSRICATRYGVSSLYVSTDTGNTWAAKAIPGGAITRGEVEVTDANTGLAYVLLGPQFTGSFRGLYSYNWNTEAFTLITNTPNIFSGAAAGGDNGGFPWWAIGLGVSPTNANNMLMGGVIGRRSTTGGSTWAADNDILHADSHGYAYNPLNGQVFAMNDGGIFRSSNDGDTWTNITGNLQITQYYRMSGVDANSNILLAGAQDNGHHLRTTNTTTFNHVITCCDGMDNGINYSNTNIMYGFTQYGGLNKSIDGGATFFGIVPTISGSEPWVTPFLVHTTTPTTIFYSSVNGLLRHTASGEPANAWVNLGGGGATIDFAMGTSNTDRGYLATGTTIRRTDNLSNAAPVWTIKSGNPGWPSLSGASITSLDVNPDNSLEIWVSLSGYNAAVKVLHSTDGGDNWVNETDNLPNVPVHVIKFQDTNGAPSGAVYIGTDIGVFYRDNVNTGSQWIQYGNDLPRTMVTDMEVNETAGVITVSTYGRGFWRSPLFSGCDANLALISSLSGSQYHQASSTITINNTITGGAGTQVFLKANGSITMNPGFEIKAGNEMKAYIGPCQADAPVFRVNPAAVAPAVDTLNKPKPQGRD
jgi:photosystem II stability/assembly factor-like uncharacterized protein